MIRLFRRHANVGLIDRLYAAIVATSRAEVLYRLFGIADTFEGRFESVSLHAILVLRRLQACPPPGPDIAQDLVDTLFRHFDRTLREIGVGDTTVPKRMKSLAEAFLGRSVAYDLAIRSGEGALAAALARNVYSDGRDAIALSHYVMAYVAALDEAPLQQFIDGVLPLVGPAAFVTETTP